ncbi:hypothetical protein [Streptomyces sp. JB150]|uniref:hypothetical protein n=1 Tax=Streptomyces sp. JB150 TaxID=2714844 RepID=UPI00140D1907|nr:hypothetical protein [Streptomyces sp. JB150]QIJ61919.1 hypothetical protein G7Z13_07605 [Streptomyces sp. JB150]
MPALRHLVFDFTPAEKSLAELPFATRLTGLGFFRAAAAMKLTGLEALRELEWLTVNEDHQWLDFLAAGAFAPLRTLQVLDVRYVDLARIVPHQDLEYLYVGKADRVGNVAALAELPLLRKVHFSRCGSLDAAPPHRPGTPHRLRRLTFAHTRTTPERAGLPRHLREGAVSPGPYPR